MTRNARLEILVVSNLWPPHFVGGYELGASEVASHLAARGHRVTVLTSMFGELGPTIDGNVHRVLFSLIRRRNLGPRQLLAESVSSARAGRRVRRLLRSTRFDIVYLFSPVGLNSALLEQLTTTGRSVVAYVSDDWVSQWPRCDRLFEKWMRPRPYPWTDGNRVLVLARWALRRAGVFACNPEVPIRHAQFVSRYVRGISIGRLPLLASEMIIPWGIDIGRYPFRARMPGELRNWILVGQVEAHKGVQTAVDAVALLRSQGEPVTMTIYGSDTTAFARALRERVARSGLASHVRFAGARPREQLPGEAYHRGGLFLLPSVWKEPFSITLLEAFASGIPVLATSTGGTGEIVRDGETATVFEAEDAAHLAAQYQNLLRHPARASVMASRARRIVEEYLDIEAMVDRVESHLLAVRDGCAAGSSGADSPRLHPWEDANMRVLDSPVSHNRER